MPDKIMISAIRSRKRSRNAPYLVHMFFDLANIPSAQSNTDENCMKIPAAIKNLYSPNENKIAEIIPRIKANTVI